MHEWLDEILTRITVWFLGDRDRAGAVEYGPRTVVWIAWLIVVGFVIPAVTLFLGLVIYFSTEDIMWQRWGTLVVVDVGVVLWLIALCRMPARRRRPRHLLLFVLGALYGLLATREVIYATDPAELAQFVMFSGIVAGFFICASLGSMVAAGMDVSAMVLGEKSDPRFLRGYFRAIAWIVSVEIAIALFGVGLPPKLLIVGIVFIVSMGMLAYALRIRISWDRMLLKVQGFVVCWIFLAAIPAGFWLNVTTVNLRPFFQLHRASVVASRQHDRQVRREEELERKFVTRRFAEIERKLDEAETLEEVRAAREARKAFEAEIAQDGAAAQVAAAIKNKFPR